MKNMKNNLTMKLDDSTNPFTSVSANNSINIWKTYHENGQIKCETPLINDKNMALRNVIMKVVS